MPLPVPRAARSNTDHHIKRERQVGGGAVRPRPTGVKLEARFDPMFRIRRQPEPHGPTYVQEVR